MRNYYPLINSMGSGAAAIDADAQAFITAAAITDSTQQSAINTLVTDLKGYGIWTKMKAIYPFVGGSASSHKFNLKDPRDLDVAFRVQFINGWTHSATGAKPNGTDAYATTYLSPNNQLSNNNVHLSHYSRTQITSTNSHDLGSEDTVGGLNFNLYQYYNSVNAKGFLDGSYPNDTSQINNTNTLGLLIGSRTANNIQKLHFNGSLLATNTNVKSLSLSYSNIYLGSTNRDNVATAFSSREIAFSSIGDGLSDTEAFNFYTAVNAYQVALSRNV
jgi:hypothetical protein